MIEEIKRTLWATADQLRANMDAAVYKQLVLGIIFVEYISDTFQYSVGITLVGWSAFGRRQQPVVSFVAVRATRHAAERARYLVGKGSDVFA